MLEVFSDPPVEAAFLSRTVCLCHGISIVAITLDALNRSLHDPHAAPEPMPVNTVFQTYSLILSLPFCGVSESVRSIFLKSSPSTAICLSSSPQAPALTRIVHRSQNYNDHSV